MMKEVVIETGAKVILAAAFAGIVATLKKLWNSEKATRKGTLSLLRADLIRCYEKYTEREYCPIYARDALELEYEAYHALGGNGTITSLMETLRSLPTEPPKGDNS